MVCSRLLAGLSGLLISIASLAAQTAPSAEPAKEADKAAAYYNYSIGHLYAELAGAYGNRGDLFAKAVDSFKLALKADPSATFIAEELSELYIQSGRLREAVTETEDVLKQNPGDLNSRRILARIYTRLIGDAQQNKIDETMLKKALEQYRLITAQDATDIDSWLNLGRLEKISQDSVEAEKAYKKVLALDPDNEEGLTGLAMVYSDLGDAKSATELLRKAAEKNPTARSLMILAGAYEQIKDYALASETLKRALTQSPGNNDIQRALAQDLLLSDHVDEAIRVYEDVLADEPKDPQSWMHLSQAYRLKRNFAKAREASDKAKELDPDNLELRYNDVSLLEAEGKVGDAIVALKAIVDSTAKSSYSASERTNRVLLLDRLAYLYRANEQYAKAVEVYRQVAEVDPDSSDKSAAAVIDTYRVAHDFTKAQQEAAAAAKKFPDDRLVAGAQAQLLADMGKSDQAAAETRKLLNGKDDRDVYIALAQIYEKAKNFTEMGKALDAADKLSNSTEDKDNIAFMRGAMYERMKNYDAAETEFRRLLATNADNAAALNYLGYMLADRNVRLEEAQQLVNHAVEQEPDNGAYLDSLGWVYFRLNKLPEAERTLRRALELRMASDPTVHDHLGDVYFREGKIREAVAQWEHSLKDWENGAPAELDQDEVAKVQKKLDSAKVRLARESH